MSAVSMMAFHGLLYMVDVCCLYDGFPWLAIYGGCLLSLWWLSIDCYIWWMSAVSMMAFHGLLYMVDVCCLYDGFPWIAIYGG